MNSALITPEVRTLLSEAAEWRLLGLLFEYPTQEWRARISALLPSLESAELRALAGAAIQSASEGLHLALFGPSGSVPVREVSYQGGVQFGYLMSELAAFYDAFGFAPGVHEPDDHLSVKLAFISYLKLKQANALVQDEPGNAATASSAATEFIHSHLAVQAEPLLLRMEDFAPAYLLDAGRRLLALAGPAPRSGYPLGGLAFEDDSEPMACSPISVGDDLIQLQP